MINSRIRKLSSFLAAAVLILSAFFIYSSSSVRAQEPTHTCPGGIELPADQDCPPFTPGPTSPPTIPTIDYPTPTSNPPAPTGIPTATQTAPPAPSTQGSCESGFESVNGLCIPKNPFAGNGPAGATTVGGLISIVLKILLTLSGVVALLFVVVGGFWYLSSGGNEEQAKKGKKAITAALIGLVIIILSYVIVTIITNALTKGTI